MKLTRPVGDRDHALGPEAAPVTLLVYGDYECSFTRRAYLSVQRVHRKVGDRLRFVFRHFPLSHIHSHAQRAAEAAETAATQGQFWEMHDQLFRRQRQLDDLHLGQYAVELGLDGDRFDREMATRAHAARVLENYESGRLGGVRQTPTLFLNGAHYAGPYDPRTLLAIVENASVLDEDSVEIATGAGPEACEWRGA